MEYEPKVSIVVLTYNSARTITPCLQAIAALDYPQDLFEVLVLDNGSTDKTTEIISQLGFNSLALPDYNLSELRNYGAGIASGEIIAFIDSDCLVAGDWCRQVVKWFKDPAVGIVGNEYLLPGDPTVFERNWYNKSNFGVKYNELIPAGNMAIRKEQFQQLGGFDNRLLTGEDDYIVKVFRQAGLSTISDHQIASVHLGNAKNLRQYFRKETWYGLGMLGTVQFAQFDKPLLATLVFFLGLFLAFFFLVMFIIYEHTPLLLLGVGSVFCALLIPLLSAIDRIYRKDRRGNLFYVTLIFVVFFTARLRALLQIIGMRGSWKR